MPVLKPIRAIQINRNHPLARGLVAFWLLNEGSGGKVFDCSGSNNAGVFYGNTSWSGGRFGTCLNFDGTGDYVDCGNSTSLRITKQITISFWVNPLLSGFVEAYGGIVCRVSGGSEYQNRILLQNNGRILSQLNIGGVSDNFFSTGVVAEGQWSHIVYIYDGINESYYINGKYDSSDSETGDISSAYDNLLIGVGQLGGSLNYYFNGRIDNVCIYSRALTASEIALLYREPFCMFERATSPAILFVPTIDLAGTSTAQSSTFATVKRVRRIRGSCSATAETSTILKIVAEVLLAGSIYASVFPLGKLTLSYRGPWLKSPLKIERQWLTDALLLGMTANAFKLGTALSSGWFWMRPTGCCVLYRGHSMEQIDFTNILAVVELGAEIMSLPSYVPHCSSSTYFYVVRRFNICGYQERTLATAVKVSIDAQGSLAQPQPNNIFAARADQVAGNKVQLTWFYCPLEQKSQPMRFKVYCDSATGKIDYENPIATIGYGGQKFYSYQNDALPAGRYLFAIRAEDAGGVVNNSLAQLAIQISTQSPDVIDILSAEVI